MSDIKLDALRKQLKAGKLEKCYILHGKESYLRDHYVRELRKAVLGAEDDPFNLRRLEGKDMALSDLADALDAYPSFAERTLVEVHDYDLFKGGEDAAERLTTILTRLPDYCCLLFIYDVEAYKPDRRRKKLCQLLDTYATAVEFPIQGQNELVRWIQKHFEARHKSIRADDAAYLIFLCGSAMDNLSNEIGKIAVYAQDKVVTRSDIDAAAAPIVEAEAFRLTDALSARDYEQAAELMYKLFQLSTEPISLNALIGAQLRRLYAAKLVKAAGGSAATLAEVINTGSEYMPKQYLRVCTAFSEGWYRSMIRRSAETDYQMKSSGADPNELLCSLFLALAAPEA